jgi:hypothetical protein
MIRVVSTPSRTQKVASVDHNLHRRGPFAANDADMFEYDGPASAPTILVEIEAIALPTALPAPPLLPALGGIDTASSLRATRPNIFLVGTRATTGTIRRTTRPMEMAATLQLLEALRPSTPPTSPPPPMRRAA